MMDVVRDVMLAFAAALIHLRSASTQVQIGRSRGVSGGRTQRLLEAPILPAIARSRAGLVLALYPDRGVDRRIPISSAASAPMRLPDWPRVSAVMLLQMIRRARWAGRVSSAVAARSAAAHPAAGAAWWPTRCHRARRRACVPRCCSALRQIALRSPAAVLTRARAGVAYSDVLFAGAVLVWLANTFASALRAAAHGDSRDPLSTAALVRFPSGRAHARLVAVSRPRHPRNRSRLRAGLRCRRVRHGRLSLVELAQARGSDWRLERRPFGEILRVGAAVFRFQPCKPC